MHHKEEFGVDLTIFKSSHGSYRKSKGTIPSGLPVMQRDYPINAHTMTRSKAHITGPSVGVS